MKDIYFLIIKFDKDIKKILDKIIAYVFGTNDLEFSDEDNFPYSSVFWQNVSDSKAYTHDEYQQYYELNLEHILRKIKKDLVKEKIKETYYKGDILRLYDTYLVDVNFGDIISFYNINLNDLGQNTIAVAFKKIPDGNIEDIIIDRITKISNENILNIIEQYDWICKFGFRSDIDTELKITDIYLMDSNNNIIKKYGDNL